VTTQLKITADTSDVKKSILDIGKSVKDLKGSKVAIFSAEDKKFLKGEMKKEIGLMKQKLKDNRAEISAAVKEQQKMVEGSKEELELRKKILEAYKVQAKLGRDLGQAQKGSKDTKNNTGGIMDSVLGIARMIPALAAAATIGYALSKGKASSDQYVGGSGSRNQLKGLGVSDENFGSPEQLARVGLTEQDMIQRRNDATSTLGRQGSGNETEMRKAAFERAYGLQGGTMTGIAGQLRGQKGGEGANDAQMKLQASVFASGIEDAIGPYLQSAVQLLTSINEAGTANTDEITNLMAQLTKDGQRTPELIAKTFAGMDSAVKGATGENSAFLQTAFARSGIGGGTLGGTKYAMSSGGIMGQNRGELEKRGYNKDLLDNMENGGMFTGAGKRTGAILDQIKSSGGLKAGESVGGVKSSDQMVGMNNLANNVFGTKGDQGFDALMMLEKVQNKQMSQKQFDEKLKKMKEGEDPSLSRLDTINKSLSGQTELLSNINTNLMEALGKQTAQGRNALVRSDNQGIIGVDSVAGAVNESGLTKGAGDLAEGSGRAMNSGILGEKMADWSGKGRAARAKVAHMTSESGVVEFAKKRRDEGKGFIGMSDEEIEKKVHATMSKSGLAKDIGKEVGKAMKEAPITNTNINKIQMPDGSVTNRINK